MIQINSIYHDIQLSFGTSDVKRTTIKQNSEDTHVLRIKLYDKQNNEITIDSNWNINISAIKGDKTHILNTNNISVKDNTVYVTMTKQMLSASGTERCELIIQDGDQTLFSDTFLIYVEPNVQDGSFIESSNEYDSIIDTLQHVEEKKDRVDQLTSEIEETKFVLTEDKDIAGGVSSLDVNAKVPISELYEATTSNKGITQLTDSVTSTSTTTAATPNSVKSVKDSLNSEISRATNVESVLTARIDTITNLPEGSTTGDAELQDIRVKADGTIAENAGNAVREQISELKSDFGNLRFSITENNLLHVERKE